MITLNALNTLSGIRHGFFTRRGGVSTDFYDSLNCGLGSNDELETVRKNRTIAAEKFGVAPEQLVTMFQVHGKEVARVTEAWADTSAPNADGVVTDQPGIMLGALAADCAPLLFADPDAKVIGACHAGWKGALAGVAQETITAMEALGADRSNITGAIGPCISFVSYEVGPEFRKPFMEQDEANDQFFAAGDHGDRERFDLAGYLTHRLGEFGLGTLVTANRDTLTDEASFFSYRRSCHRQEPDYGRNLSAIMLEG
ncbi:MAG: peptidoglycan editing factor PgeF [Alphaproteobacteria bacterium]|nr:peptidoglycan editing factor PgeF [Alphaproteobacteria bacterium SS10]